MSQQIYLKQALSNSKDLLSHSESFSEGPKLDVRRQNYQLRGTTDTEVCAAHSFNQTARVYYGNAKAKKSNSERDDTLHQCQRAQSSETNSHVTLKPDPGAVKYQCQERVGHMDSHVSALSARLSRRGGTLGEHKRS